jgi:hypothetical protein
MPLNACLKNKNIHHLPAFGKLFFIIFCLYILPLTVQGQGNLLITPRRVVFENGKRTAEVNVANIGSDSARYLVSLVEMRMKEDGTFETITEPDSGQSFASKYLRFFPRSVYLGPKEPQVVKIQIYNTGSLPPGEYRSHIYFRAIPNDKPLGDSVAAAEPGTISVQLVPVFGITIPVIIRIGENHTQIEFQETPFKMANDTIPRLELSFLRTGNMSVYGDVLVDHISNEGVVTRVFIAKGLAVYTPNKTRKLGVNLDRQANVNYKKGKLRITYTAQGDKREVLAEKEISLE